MPWFEEFHKQYAAQGIEILGLADDVDAGKDKIARTAQQDWRASYPILLTDGKVQVDGLRRAGCAAGFLLYR